MTRRTPALWRQEASKVEPRGSVFIERGTVAIFDERGNNDDQAV